MAFIAGAILGSAVLGVGGAMVAGNATRKSQQQANSEAKQQAADKNLFDWNSYLMQRGIGGGATAPGQIPTGSGAVNTFLPLWATTNGKPTEQILLDQILGRMAPDPNNWLSLDNTTAALASNPAMREELAAMLSESGDNRSPEQWLLDDLNAGDTNSAFINAVKGVHQGKIDAYKESVAVPQEYLDLQNKAVGTVNDLFDGRFLDKEIGALAPILAARQKAAQDIYAATETGARSVYDADLLQADTYGQAALQALNRMLAQNTAQRARQGFVGSGSGNALNRARLTADSSQQAAGVRARAGQDLASRLAAAGVGRATTLGAADEQDALQRLALMTNDTSRRLGAVNLPGSLYNQKLGMERAAADSKYADIDSLLSRLNVFRSGATPAGYTTANVQPVMGSGQIAGAAIQSLAQGVGDYFTTKGLINAVNKSNIPTIDADVSPGWWK